MEKEPSSFAENRIHSDTFFVCVFLLLLVCMSVTAQTNYRILMHATFGCYRRK